MAKNSRKQFVQARLNAIGGDATPEQKAKLRERFNTLSKTKEGRTRIAQVVLPEGTAAERKALKATLRPAKTSTGDTAGSTTNVAAAVTSKNTTFVGQSPSKKTVGVVPPKATVVGPSVSTTSTTVPRSSTSTTSTTVPQTTTTTKTTKTTNFMPLAPFPIPPITKQTSSGPSDGKKVSDFLFKGMPGTKEWKAKPGGFGPATDLPLGIGRVIEGGKQFKNAKSVGDVLAGTGKAALGVAEFVLTFRVGKSKNLLNQPPKTSASNKGLVKEFNAFRAGEAAQKPLNPYPNFGSPAQQRATTEAPSTFIGPIAPRPQFGTVSAQRAAAEARNAVQTPRPQFGTVKEQRAAYKARNKK